MPIDKYRLLKLVSLFIIITAFTTTPLAAQDTSRTTTNPEVIQRVAVVRGQGAQLLNAASREAKAQLPAGSLLILIARSTDGGLLYVESGLHGGGWVSASSLLTVNANELPMQAVATSANPLPANNNNTPASTLSTNNRRFQVDSTQTDTDDGIYARITLTDEWLNLRAGPGTNYAVVAKAGPSTELEITGRTATGEWVQMVARSTNETAWGAATYMALNRPLDDVPIVSVTASASLSTTTDTPILMPTRRPAPIAQATAPPALPTQNKTGLSGILVFNDRIGGTIYGYDLETDRMWAITSGIDPALSPDTTQVAFTRDGGGNGLYVINLDGNNERLVYSGQEMLRSPKWRPDGQYVVFSRSNGYDDCRLLHGGVCLPDEAILEGLPAELQFPEVVNAVRELRNQRQYFTILTRIGPDGNNYRDIPSLDKAGAPDWSQHGIVYHAGPAGIQWTGDHDGQSTLVVNDELHGYFLDPDWHPTVRRIAFHRKLGSHWQIHLVNSDGTGLTAITRPVTALVDELPSSVAPAWSPDGEHIIYLSNRNSIESAGAWHFWVMDADGTNQRRLPIDLPLYYTFSSEQMVSWRAKAVP
ncbi:MAG: hypothetical protein AAF639_33525 [Chloroflexota bacterium]